MAIFALTGACEATVPGLGVDEGDPRAELEGQFNRDVLPLLQLRCDSCHAGSRAGIGFSEITDEYQTVYDHVKAWPALVNTEAPSMSRLITKGQHEGPAWEASERDLIIPWLQAEGSFGDTGEEVETDEITLIEGINTIDLGGIGLTHMAGTSISFEYTRTSSLLYFSSISFTANAQTGAFIENPVFTMIIDNTAYPDPINTFDGVKLDLAPGGFSFLGGGTLIRSDLASLIGQGKLPTLVLRFKQAIGEGTGVDNSDPFACKLPDDPDFTAFRNAINGQNCGNGNCHSVNDEAAGGGGFSVFGWNSADPMEVAAFCKNVRGKVNLQNPDGNYIIVDKNNGTTGHNGGANGAVGAWEPPLRAWVAKESVAP